MPTSALKIPPSTIQEALRRGVAVLQAARIESASLDARVLLEHVLHMSREQLIAHLDRPVSQAEQERYRTLLVRRAGHEPVAHLTGRREFWGMDFKVTAATLDPRPDSETLIETALARIHDRAAPLNLLDIGTGTGCLLLALLKELPGARGRGLDASEAALAVAKENALRFGLQARTTFAVSHWCDQAEGTFDIVVANPPYIPSTTINTLAPEVAQFEPRLALDGGEDGLDAYRVIMPALPELLKPQGFAALEIGAGQEEDVGAIAAGCGLQVVETVRDLGGVPRCMMITLER